MFLLRDEQEVSFMVSSKRQLLRLVHQRSENGDFHCSKCRANKRKRRLVTLNAASLLRIPGSFADQLRTANYNLLNVVPMREVEVL